jgi:hypothetical protein
MASPGCRFGRPGFLKERTVTDNPASLSESGPALQGRRHSSLAGLLLTLLSFLVYNANLRVISAGDNYPARYLPFGILRYGTVLVDPIADVTAQGDAHPYWLVDKYGHTFSKYPIAVPVLVTPLYVPAVAFLQWRGWTDQRLDEVARVMEKLTSSLIASASVGFMYLLLVRRARCRGALWLTLAYGFGTNTWMIGSQALWQHGLAELLLVVSLFVLLGPCTAKRAFGAGIVLALVGCVRPPDAILATALGLFGLRWSKGRVRFLVTGAAIPLALLLAYNFRVAHHFAGGYGLRGDLSFFRYSLPCGVLGLLFSPARGLFVFSPFLLFLPFCLGPTLREPRVRTLALLLLGAVVAQVMLYAKLDWRAGCCWGPRWLTDVLPLLVWMLAAGLESLGRIGRAVFALAACLSVGVQVVGAFWYTGHSDAVIMKAEGDPNRMDVVWDFWNAPFIAELRHDPAPRELTLEADGFVDRVRADGQDVAQVVPGTALEVDGWALTDRCTPERVRVMVVPIRHTKWQGRRRYPIAETASFLDRPDVTRAMHGTGPAGWQVVLKTDGLDPGPHRVEVKARAHQGGEFRAVAERPFLVLPAQPSAPGTAVPGRSHGPGVPTGMNALFGVAGERLRSRQNANGYWLTAHTQSLQFDHPAFEMNTFATSMIVDVLAPVAGAAGLEKNLKRARRHLLSQIESGGLVRYHGRPGSPAIPSLGCLITPDADDTTLVWRIAGRDRDPRLAGVLKALQSYRSREGLYRTWLAPREQFVGVDPGRDPNPTDVGIQMNVLMFFAGVDPPAAEALRRALQAAAGEDRIWVYYKKAPLVPLLRETDLHKLGYAVCLPPERVKTSVPGQEVWVRACELLARYVAKAAPPPAREETRALLESLGKNDFAAVRSNPPLFYHNDLTARVRRFYWSEDFGYALWLRLYLELTQSREMMSRLKP